MTVQEILETVQPWLIFATTFFGLVGTLYVVLPKTLRTVEWLNNLIERWYSWAKHAFIIPDVYAQLDAHENTLAGHESRITKLEETQP